MTTPKNRQAALSALDKVVGARNHATRGAWYRVETPWIDSQTPTYIVAGSPDPHGAVQVAEADCDAEEYDAELDRVWHDCGFIADAESFIREHAYTIREALQAQSTDALREALELARSTVLAVHHEVGGQLIVLQKIDKALEPAGKEGEE